MAVDFIEEIYYFANTISSLKKVVDYTRAWDDLHATRLLKSIIGDVQKLCEACLEDNFVQAEELKNHLLQIPRLQKDIILLGDMLEYVAIPIMEKWMQTISGIEQQLDENLIAESTATGFLTLKDINEDIYYHSNNDPMDAARVIIEKQYDYSKSKYVVFGCGLGYEVYQLYKISRGTIPIAIYETNPDIIGYAMNYGVLSWIPENVVSAYVIESAEDFLSEAQKPENGVFMHLPTINSLKNMEVKNAILREYVNRGAVLESAEDLKINLYRNLDCGHPDISRLDKNKIKNQVVIVAAGPSLDQNLETIKAWQGEKTIIAVGTVLKKLLKAGIRPDFFAMMDPYQSVLSQVQGLEDYSIPMLYNITTYWEVARTYRGEAYSICVEQGGNEVIAYGEKKGYELWPSGGTVTALAMEVAIKFGAKTIYLVGADFAYPGGLSHANGTAYQKTVDVSGMTPVAGMDGQTVYADTAFVLYRQWIEYRISQEKNIKFINMSKCGAVIKGAQPF